MTTTHTEFSQVLGKATRPLAAAIGVAALLLLAMAGYTGVMSAQTAADDRGIALTQAFAAKVVAVQAAEKDLVAAPQDARDQPKKAYDRASTELQSAFDDFRSTVPDSLGQKQQGGEIESAMGRWSDLRQQATQPEPDSATHPAIDSATPNTILGDLAAMTTALSERRAARSGGFGTIAVILALLSVAALVFGGYRLFAAKQELAASEQHDAGALDQVQALKRHKALLVTMLKTIGDAMIAVDTGGRITFMNAAAEKLTGLMESDAVGKDASKIINLVDTPGAGAIASPLSKVLADNLNHPIPAHAALVARDGTKRPVTGTCAAVWDGASVIGAAMIVRDVSEGQVAKQALQTTEAYKEAILETALDCVVLMDSDGKIVEFNPAAVATFGYTRREAIGNAVADLIVPPSLRARHIEGFNRYLSIGTTTILGERVEMTGMRKGGEEFPIEMAITTIPNVTPPVFATYIRDITDRKRAGEALQQAKDDAVEESRAKSVFLNDMSDELRTPLNAVIGYSEMLQEEAASRQVDGFVPDLQKIHSAGKLLLTMVNDVLDLSKIESGKMELYIDEFDVADVIEEIVRAVQPLVDANENTLTVVAPSNIGLMRSDRIKVRQTVLYLISNAARFAHNRSLVLEVKRVKTAAGDQLVFRVADTSPGLPPEQLEKLAEAYSAKGADRTYRFGGHGLGLAIAHQLCEMMGGETTVTRETGRSPEFEVTLPAIRN